MCEAAVLRRDGGEADYYDDEGDAVFETCLVALDIVCLKQIARTRYTIVILQHMCDSKRRSRRATLRLVAHARCTARSLQLS